MSNPSKPSVDSAADPVIWGIHMGLQHGSLPIENNYIAIGWKKLGDLSTQPMNRDALKELLQRHYTGSKAGAVPVHAGILYRFAHEMQPGDIVVYPSKLDRVVHIGEIAGDYQFDCDASDEPGEATFECAHRRQVHWRNAVPRAALPQRALNEIGSALTLFRVANNPEPFLEALVGRTPSSDEQSEDADAAAASEDVEERTEDFILRRLKNGIDDERFEHFVAHLLRCMGYHARVTRKSGDGGVDVIAHRDELGFEKPVIKVQCKQILTTTGRPDVQRLLGAVEPDEFGLFVTLGSFSREARDTERTKSQLRLIDGQDLCNLVFNHYESFDPQWQSVVPLKRRYLAGPME